MFNDDNSENYFKTNYFLKLMRFFNLLEPDRNILSISKIFMWVMLGIMMFVLVVSPDQLEIVIPAIGAAMATMLNYSFRRYVQYMNIKHGRNDSDDLDEHNAGHHRRWRGSSKSEYDI
jgi:hypothetical protein